MQEEDAFWLLVYIIEHLMPPEYYSRDKQLIGAQVDQVRNTYYTHTGYILAPLYSLIKELFVEIYVAFFVALSFGPSLS